jgi:hypothetical protein
MEFPVKFRKATDPCKLQKTHLTVVELKNVPDRGRVQKTHLTVVEPRKRTWFWSSQENAPGRGGVKKTHLTVVESRKRTWPWWSPASWSRWSTWNSACGTAFHLSLHQQSYHLSLKVYSSHLNWGARLYSFDLLLNTRCPASKIFFFNYTFSREEHKTN